MEVRESMRGEKRYEKVGGKEEVCGLSVWLCVVCLSVCACVCVHVCVLPSDKPTAVWSHPRAGRYTAAR